MKKLLAILLCGMLTVAVLSGCGNKAEAEQPEHRGIVGSLYSDLTLKMENSGFPEYDFISIDRYNIVLIPEVSYEDNTGATMKYSVLYSDNESDYWGEIEEATFSIESDLNKNLTNFIERAKIYLTFCSSMEYDSADQEKVKAWVLENVEAAGEIEDDKDIEITIGDAKFTLSGNDFGGTYGVRTLKIEKVKN
ncbi:hypothetical protein DSECCO2_385850 [anaerobic digester metagenome]